MVLLFDGNIDNEIQFSDLEPMYQKIGRKKQKLPKHHLNDNK